MKTIDVGHVIYTHQYLQMQLKLVEPLISVAKLTEDNYEVLFRKNDVIFLKNGKKLMGRGIRRGNSYYLKRNMKNKNNVCQLINEDNRNINKKKLTLNNNQAIPGTHANQDSR